MKLRLAIQLTRNMGLRYVAFRLKFALEKKTGILRKRFPVHASAIPLPSLGDWKSDGYRILARHHTDFASQNQELASSADNIRSGSIQFFSSEWKQLGKNYDWVTNPDSGFHYGVNTHWSDINDYSASAGDIKFVWEKSRFTFVHTLIRDQFHNGTSHDEFVFSEIDDWINKNPVNVGPNYKCSQEISLRVFNWLWALSFYANSPSLNNERWDRIMHAIYWQMHHVYHNINFSRIAVRNNHAITETLALYVVGLIFPDFPGAAEWKNKGRRWFEQEVKYQVYCDGTFLQFSMNYHRVVIQLLTLAIKVAHRKKERFTSTVYERAYASLNFLYQCQDEQTGWLPNYGANDGALFFPLSQSDYRDYRPQLNALHHLLCGSSLYPGNGDWQEDAFWWGSGDFAGLAFQPLQRKYGCSSFDVGGYYIFRDKESLTFIRCGNHKDRPSQADNLHLDIWVNGRNVLLDGGSYKYNADATSLKYFMGTGSHNTVMLGEHDQMLKGGRFIWYFWTQAVGQPKFIEQDNGFLFEGTVKCFLFLNPKISHTRTVIKSGGTKTWQVKDVLNNKPPKSEIVVNWHVPSQADVRITGSSASGPVTPTTSLAPYSPKYGIKEDCTLVQFRTMSRELNVSIEVN